MKHLLSLLLLISVPYLALSQKMNKNIFVINEDTVVYYRPDAGLIETLKRNSMVWNQVNYCISYLNKMQEALKNKHELSILNKPDMSMHEAISSIKEKCKKERKIYQALSEITPELFQNEYDSYILLDKKILESSYKDKKLIFSNDSIEALKLFEKIAHICNPEYKFSQAGIARHSLKKIVKFGLSDNSTDNELVFSYYVTTNKEIRLSIIQGSFEDIYQIWTMYFGSNDNKEDFKEFPYSKTMTIRINGISQPLNIIMNPAEEKWRIKI